MLRVIMYGIFMMGATAACGTLRQLNDEDAPISMNASFQLNEVQKIQLMDAANNGDNEAAERLAQYFDFVNGNHAAAYFWFKKAALNGHVRSQFNLGVRSLGIKTFESCTEAVSWFSLASSNGMEKAKQALDRMGDCSKMKK